MDFRNDAYFYLFALVILIVAGFIYFLPSILGKNKKNWGWLFLCNLFFGCTGVGWVICLIWGLSSDD